MLNPVLATPRFHRLLSRTLLPAAVLFATTTSAWAEPIFKVRWPTTSSRGPNLVGAPDEAAVVVSTSDDATVSRFDCGTLYSNLATLLDVPVATLRAADVIAFEVNGGSPGEAGGWESSEWLFTEGPRSLTVIRDAVANTSTPAGVVLADASISAIAYQEYFGISTPSGATVISFLLFDLPADLDVNANAFTANVQGYASGQGTPDPDAIGVLAPSVTCNASGR